MSRKPSDPLNDLMPFVDFVGAHPVGSQVEAEVESFSSHGAYAMVGDVRCYVPLKSMGDPPPARARDLLDIGETCSFTVVSIDAPHRGIDLALVPGASMKSKVTSHPLPQGVPIGTVARSVSSDDTNKYPTATVVTDTNSSAKHSAKEAPVTPVKKAAAKKAPAKKAPAKKAAARKAPAKRAVKRAVAKKAVKKAVKKTVKRAVAKKATAKKTAARKAPARKAAAKRAPAKRAPAKKTAARKTAAKKTPARKSAAKKAPAKRATAARKR